MPSRRSQIFFGSPPCTSRTPSLAALRAVHAEVSIYGWLDSWCLGWAWFDWEGGPVWGWDGVVNGERSVPADRAGTSGRRRLDDQRQHRACDVPLAVHRADGIVVRDQRPASAPRPLRPVQPATSRASLASTHGPTGGWRSPPPGAAFSSRPSDGETEALPLDGRTFLVDAADPDNPTVTFGGFDAAGRPRILYVMLWGLPRLDE